MKVPRKFIRDRSTLLAVAIGFASAMAARYAVSGDARTARVPFDSSVEERRAFVVAGAGGVGMTSVDGVDWTPRSVTVATNWQSQCRGKGISVRISHDGQIWKSSNDT